MSRQPVTLERESLALAWLRLGSIRSARLSSARVRILRPVSAGRRHATDADRSEPRPLLLGNEECPHYFRRTPKPGNDVRQHLFIGVAQVRRTVHIINGSRDVE